MPNRIIKESICTSDSIDKLSAFQETMFYRMIVNCDDYGRMDARPKVLASKLFPLKDIRLAQIEDALRALTSAELVTLYKVGGKPFLQMLTWDKHQQIRAKKPKYPGAETSDSICNHPKSSDCKCSRNPIQSESEYNPNPNPKESACGGYFGVEISDEQAHDHMVLLNRIENEAQKWGISSSPGNLETAINLANEYSTKWLFMAMERAGNGASKTWHYITGILRSWKEQGKPDEPGSKPANSGKTVSAQNYSQREYTEDDLDNSGDLFAEVKARRAAQ